MPLRGRGCCALVKLRWRKTGPEEMTGLLTGPPGLEVIRPRFGGVILLLAGSCLGLKTGPVLMTKLLTAPGFEEILPRGGSGCCARTGLVACRKTGPGPGLLTPG